MLRRAAAALVLVGAVLFIYRAAIPAYFFEDDFQWLVSRWSFRPADLFDLSNRSHFYRPVIELYFWIASPFFGGSAVAFHLASIALHVLNAGLVYLVAVTLGTRPVWGFVAALLFAVLPGYVHAVAWVGAIAEPLGACFGCLSLYGFLKFRERGGAGWRIVSVAGLAGALLTHESSVVFLPLLAMIDWTAGRWSWRVREVARMYWPYLAVTAGYLAVDLTVNARHYLIAEGQYAVGLHMVRNIFEYLSSLYVGERTILAHVVVGGALAWVFIRGRRRAQFAAGWMLIAMLPFAPLAYGRVSRYLYLPAIGFSLLLAEGLAALDAAAARRGLARARVVGLVVIVLFLTVRFGNFARRGVADFGARTEEYRAFLTALRQTHPTLADGFVLTVDERTERRMPLRYLEAAVQWEYGNPTVRLVVGGR